MSLKPQAQLQRAETRKDVLEAQAQLKLDRRRIVIIQRHFFKQTAVEHKFALNPDRFGVDIWNSGIST